jgi:hypothetical protein
MEKQIREHEFLIFKENQDLKRQKMIELILEKEKN